MASTPGSDSNHRTMPSGVLMASDSSFNSLVQAHRKQGDQLKPGTTSSGLSITECWRPGSSPNFHDLGRRAAVSSAFGGQRLVLAINLLGRSEPKRQSFLGCEILPAGFRLSRRKIPPMWSLWGATRHDSSLVRSSPLAFTFFARIAGRRQCPNRMRFP